MNNTATRVDDIPRLTHGEAMRLAETEYARFLDLLQHLGPHDWSRPTDCERWTVEAITSHLVAMCDAFNSFREMARQQKAGKAVSRELGLNKFDGWTEAQSRMFSAHDGLAGRYRVLTAEHDGRFVANIVADLAKRWKQPFVLELEGPAGGAFVHGTGGEIYRLDAVEFCRVLSGRGAGHGLPAGVVPF